MPGRIPDEHQTGPSGGSSEHEQGHNLDTGKKENHKTPT